LRTSGPTENKYLHWQYDVTTDPVCLLRKIIGSLKYFIGIKTADSDVINVELLKRVPTALLTRVLGLLNRLCTSLMEISCCCTHIQEMKLNEL